MSIADEDVAVRGDRDFGWRVELIVAGAGNAFLSERQQYFSISATKLEHLMAAVVGHPEIAVLVDGELVRAHKQTGAKTFQQLARCVELEDRRDGHVGAGAGDTASA